MIVQRFASSATFAEAVDRTLYLHRASFHRGDRVGDAQARIVVTMNADGLPTAAAARTPLQPLPAAIRLACHTDTERRAFFGGHSQARDGVIRIGRKAVEEMFGVEHQLVDLLLQVTDGLRDELEILIELDTKRVEHLRAPCLGDDRDDGRLARTSIRMFSSSEGARPGRAVEPNAAMRALLRRSVRTWSKYSASRGFEPGQPPST